MKCREIVIVIFSLIAIITTGYTVAFFSGKAGTDYVRQYSEATYAVERQYIENIPVYRDFAAPSLVAELQKYDLGAHALQVVKTGIKPVHNENEIIENVKNGKLVEVKADNELFYFHNVRKEYRYLTPDTINGMRLVAQRFQNKLTTHSEGLPQVKIAISSVIRTVDYQEKLFGRKFVSTHSYGGCFDIFFDDYFIVIPEVYAGSEPQKKISNVLHTRFGFLMGDALREQLRTVLMESLLELQREGVLYAYLEEDNRCYHVTILQK